MNINRNIRQVGDARQKIKFCLDLLEEEGFSLGIGLDTQITVHLKLETIIDALVHAAQQLEVV